MFGEDGRPLEKVFVEYDSVASAADFLAAIRKSHRKFQIESFEPHIEYFHPPERSRSPEQIDHAPLAPLPLDSANNVPDWMLQLDIVGLPVDFQSKYEIEGLLGHILGSAHPSHILRSIGLSSDNDASSTTAHVTFTDHIHLAELMNRTFGVVVLRGFHLTLVPHQPPIPISVDGADPIANEQTNPLPPIDVVYKTPIRFAPHPLAPPHHEYVFHPPSGSILDITSGLFFHPHLGCFVDLDGRVLSFDDPRVLCLPPTTDPTTSSSSNHVDTPTSSEDKAIEMTPVPQGPIEFTLKSSTVSSSKPRQSSLLQAQQSKLAHVSSQGAGATSEANPMQAPTRGGRLFVNIPHDRPARATLPALSREDLPFTRGGDICLVCQAKFSSPTQLKEHVKTSAKHAQQLRQTLERFGLSLGDLEEGEMGEASLHGSNPKKRQRSAEEHELETQAGDLDDGLPTLVAPPSPMNAQGEPTPSTTANIGMKLMQKIGYQGGKLGRNAK